MVLVRSCSLRDNGLTSAIRLSRLNVSRPLEPNWLVRYPAAMSDRYDTMQTWEWNLRNAPQPSDPEPVEAIPGTWSWCGVPASSPLGIPAGPLLNGQWLLYYAQLGFDILVYKTVRSAAHDCYELPNLLPVRAASLSEPGTTVAQQESMNGSWAVSFGMPSQAPEVWRDDVNRTRDQLSAGKVLIVSVVGSVTNVSPDGPRALDVLADDFAMCARWAVDAGAHGVEANFSCPNVATADGQLYQQPDAAALVAERIRDQIGTAPLALKIGRVLSESDAESLIDSVGSYVDGIAMTNSVAAFVDDTQGVRLFGGHMRGICGDAIRDASCAQLAMFRKLVDESANDLHLTGVGGISSAAHVKQYIESGADSVAMATAVMTDPDTGRRIRQEW